MRKYQHVADSVRKKIHTGDYPAGSRLPKASQLCEQYQVSIITIKRAMDELEAQGLIVRRRGTGTFVKELGHRELEHLSSENGKDVLSGQEIHVLHFYVRHPQPDIAEKLMISVSDFVYDIHRIYHRDEQTAVLESLAIPTLLLPGMRERYAAQSLDDYIEQTLGVPLQSSHCTMRALLPTREERAYLHLTEGEPALEVRQIKYLMSGSPCLYSRSLICGKNAAIHTVSLRYAR